MLALKTNDSRTLGSNPKQKALADSAKAINEQDLVQLMDKDGVLLRFPPALQDCLLQRSYTFATGSEAYPEVSLLIHELPPLLKHIFFTQIRPVSKTRTSSSSNAGHRLPSSSSTSSGPFQMTFKHAPNPSRGTLFLLLNCFPSIFYNL